MQGEEGEGHEPSLEEQITEPFGRLSEQTPPKEVGFSGWLRPFQNYENFVPFPDTDPKESAGTLWRSRNFITPEIGKWNTDLVYIGKGEGIFAETPLHEDAHVLVLLPDGEKIMTGAELPKTQELLGTRLLELLIGGEGRWEGQAAPFLFTLKLPSGKDVKTHLESAVNTKWVFETGEKFDAIVVPDIADAAERIELKVDKL